MKLIVFGPKRLGAILEKGEIVDLNLAYTTYLAMKGDSQSSAHAATILPPDLQSFLEEGNSAMTAAHEAIEFVKAHLEGDLGPSGEKIVFKPEEVAVRAPIPSPSSKIANAGSNFYDHAAGVASMIRGTEVTPNEVKQNLEAGRHVPWGFWKFARNVVGPDGAVIYPARTQRLDYEVEIAAIFGRAGKDVSEKDAMNHIFGYTILNDFSLRDPQEASRSHFVLSKNFDTSVGFGPCIVTKDEVPDPYNLAMKLRVNGQVRQNGSSRDMIRRFPFWISFLTRDLTFYPGDIVSSGTCAGTALDTSPRDAEGKTGPERFLKPGDVVEAEVEKIGVLRNRVTKKP